MRLALLGYHHETNTFATQRTAYTQFVEAGILRGSDIVSQHQNAHSTVAGFLEAASWPDVELVPLMYATAEPSGLIATDAYMRITDELLALLAAHGPWDGILLALHGAAVTEDDTDPDGSFAARVRAAVGPDLPIGTALDLHANLTPRLIAQTTITTVYRTNPHLDARDRARECAALLVRAVRGEIHPVQALETPPLCVNILKHGTADEPMRSIMAGVEEVIARPGMLSASVVIGYPYADVPQMGISLLAVHDSDWQAAREAARWLAQQAWDHRAELQGACIEPEEAVHHALAASHGPVVLLDVGDNIGGGSPADSTVLLEIAQRLGARSYLQTLYDPEAVNTCVMAGPGAAVTLAVGAKTDNKHGSPITVTGHVRHLSDGQWEDPRPTHGGWRFFNSGTTAVLETTTGLTLVLTSLRTGNTSIEQMYALGLHPENMKIVVAKGVMSPRPAYVPIAAEMLAVNTPGVTTADLSSFVYQRRRIPLYPFEPAARYHVV